MNLNDKCEFLAYINDPIINQNYKLYRMPLLTLVNLVKKNIPLSKIQLEVFNHQNDNLFSNIYELKRINLKLAKNYANQSYLDKNNELVKCSSKNILIGYLYLVVLELFQFR